MILCCEKMGEILSFISFYTKLARSLSLGLNLSNLSVFRYIATQTVGLER